MTKSTSGTSRCQSVQIAVEVSFDYGPWYTAKSLRLWNANYGRLLDVEIVEGPRRGEVWSVSLEPGEIWARYANGRTVYALPVLRAQQSHP